MLNKVLILFAHPSQHRSEVNLPLFKSSQGIAGVTAIDLYQEYPQYQIDIEREQQRLLTHDCIVFMFPLYWYSTPAMLKEWQDLVLEYGFAYGQGGTALHGKKFLCALSAGGPAEAYRAEGYNHFTIRELLQPLEQTATLTGMEFLPPFALYGARNAAEENRLERHISEWRRVLLALRDGRLSTQNSKGLLELNSALDTLIQAPS